MKAESEKKIRANLTISRLMKDRAKDVMKARGFDDFSEFVSALIREAHERLHPPQLPPASSPVRFPAHDPAHSEMGDNPTPSQPKARPRKPKKVGPAGLSQTEQQ